MRIVRSLSLIAALAPAGLLAAGCAAPTAEESESEATSITASPDARGTDSAALSAPVLVHRRLPAYVEAARLSFNAAHLGGNTWTQVAEARVFATAPRAPLSSDPAAIVASLPTGLQDEIGGLRGADELDIAGVLAHHFFGGPSGAALLAALESWAGIAPGAPRIAHRVFDALPCHGCTDNAEILVLTFPSVGKVVVLRGTFGWDS